MKYLAALPILILLALGICSKPSHLDARDPNTAPPLVLSTPLEDSLPESAVKDLKLDHVTGLKFQYLTGLHSSYFIYEADPDEVLQTISQLPFLINAKVADTFCHQIPFQNMELIRQKISATESEHTAFFWKTNRVDMEVYECIKAPFKHTIQIHKNSNRILHRIEFFG